MQDNWRLFQTQVKALTDKYIPLQRISSKRRSLWFNLSLKRLLNKKKRMFRRCKKLMTDRARLACQSTAAEYERALISATLTKMGIEFPLLIRCTIIDSIEITWNFNTS